MTDLRELLIVGAGGFGREVAEAVLAINRAAPAWKLLGFLDDDRVLHGTELDGLPVLGGTDVVDAFPSAAVVVTTGHPGNYFSRKHIVDRFGLPPARYATLIHPTAVLPISAAVGPGTVLLAGAVATCAVRIGAHVAIMPGTVLTHDNVVDDFATLTAGVRLAGWVRIGKGAYVGSGALIREDRTVGPWALVGMGAVVTHDVPAGEVWYGHPARFVRCLQAPADVLSHESRAGGDRRGG